MQFFSALKFGALIGAACLTVYGQAAPPPAPAKEATTESKGMPPRTSPTEYQAQAKAGTVTIGAEFKGHSIPTMQGSTLSTEDYVVVEIGLFGTADARLKLAADDFSLRVNGKKAALPSQPYGLVVGNVKDPEWEPPTPPKSKTSMNSGGQEKGNSNDPPPVVHVPIEVQRAMAKNVQKAALPEGDRPLPQAGLIFFRYGGKTKGINSLELVYAGPAGKVTIPLAP